MTSDHHHRPGGERLDREKLAALIDGQLKGAERDAALASLAVSPDDLEIVADIAAVARELDSGATDIRQYAAARQRGRRPFTKWIAAAASLLLVATLPVVARRASAPPENAFAGMLSASAPLPPRWEEHSWSATRGPTAVITETARAVRAGALTSAIDVAASRRDSATARLATQVAALLVDVPGANPVVATYRDIATRSASVSREQLRSARQATRAMLLAPAFDDGAWLEVARIAAAGHDSAFFASAASREQLARLERDAAGDARTHDDVLSVGRLIEQRDWDAVAVATTSVLAVLAGP